MKTFFSVFVGLSVLGIFLLVRIYKRYSKKKLSLISGIAIVFGYGFCCLVALFFLFNELRPTAFRKMVKRFIPKERQGCDCTWETLYLKKDNFLEAHKPAAKRIGFYVKNEEFREKWINSGKLVDVEESEGFGISELDYSTAHLTPLARKRLYELGHRFRASIEDQNQKSSYFLVSSITRSVPQQEMLTRSNSAATKSHSPHSYGVAFDIYNLVSPDNHCQAGLLALEKVLSAMQQEGKILLCPESKCIHVTVKG
jgi:uncharacterized protein YcbK (DUF882 family)